MHLRGITLTSRYLTKDGTSILRALRVHDSLNNCEMRRNVILHRDFNQITNGKANVPCCRRAESKFRLKEYDSEEWNAVTMEYNQATENARRKFLRKRVVGPLPCANKRRHISLLDQYLMAKTTVVLRCREVEQRQCNIYSRVQNIHSFACP